MAKCSNRGNKSTGARVKLHANWHIHRSRLRHILNRNGYSVQTIPDVALRSNRLPQRFQGSQDFMQKVMVGCNVGGSAQNHEDQRFYRAEERY
jgi:hypothetical protein